MYIGRCLLSRCTLVLCNFLFLRLVNVFTRSIKYEQWIKYWMCNIYPPKLIHPIVLIRKNFNTFINVKKKRKKGVLFTFDLFALHPTADTLSSITTYKFTLQIFRGSEVSKINKWLNSIYISSQQEIFANARENGTSAYLQIEKIFGRIEVNYWSVKFFYWNLKVAPKLDRFHVWPKCLNKIVVVIFW